MKRLETYATLDEIESVAKKLKDIIPSDAVISLKGDLASGKTTLVSSIVKSSGDSGAVSPTFAIQHIYSDRYYHYDLYRVDFDTIVSLGLIEEFSKSGWHMVEWADKELLELLVRAGFNVWQVEIEPKDSGRLYKIEQLNA